MAVSRADAIRRRRDVVVAARRGMSTSSIARTYGLTDRHVRRLVASASCSPEPLTDENAAAEIRGHLACVDQVLDDLALVFDECASHAGWRLGSLRARMDALQLKMQIQAAAGVIPRNLAAPGQQQNVMVVFGQIADVLREHNVSEEALRALVHAMERHTQGSVPAKLPVAA
jgi:transposase-like protein